MIYGELGRYPIEIDIKMSATRLYMWHPYVSHSSSYFSMTVKGGCHGCSIPSFLFILCFVYWWIKSHTEYVWNICHWIFGIWLSKWRLNELNYNVIATLGSVSSLLAATLYQGNHDRDHKHWNIASTERCILHMQVLLECCYL